MWSLISCPLLHLVKIPVVERAPGRRRGPGMQTGLPFAASGWETWGGGQVPVHKAQPLPGGPSRMSMTSPFPAPVLPLPSPLLPGAHTTTHQALAGPRVGVSDTRSVSNHAGCASSSHQPPEHTAPQPAMPSDAPPVLQLHEQARHLRQPVPGEHLQRLRPPQRHGTALRRRPLHQRLSECAPRTRVRAQLCWRWGGAESCDRGPRFQARY